MLTFPDSEVYWSGTTYQKVYWYFWRTEHSMIQQAFLQTYESPQSEAPHNHAGSRQACRERASRDRPLSVLEGSPLEPKPKPKPNRKRTPLVAASIDTQQALRLCITCSPSPDARTMRNRMTRRCHFLFKIRDLPGDDPGAERQTRGYW